MNKIIEISEIEFEIFANNRLYTLRYYLPTGDDDDEKTPYYCNNVEGIYTLYTYLNIYYIHSIHIYIPIYIYKLYVYI